MRDPHYLNPQIFPSNKDLQPRDHHRILYSSIAILLCASIVGGVYWWRMPEHSPSPQPPTQNYREVILSESKQSRTYAPPETIKEILESLPAPSPDTASSTETNMQILKRIKEQPITTQP